MVNKIYIYNQSGKNASLKLMVLALIGPTQKNWGFVETYIYILVGGIPTPLKNDGVHQLG
jgi:hypothetical protein